MYWMVRKRESKTGEKYDDTGSYHVRGAAGEEVRFNVTGVHSVPFAELDAIAVALNALPQYRGQRKR